PLALESLLHACCHYVIVSATAPPGRETRSIGRRYRMERKQAIVTARAAAEALKVMGADVSFRCPAKRTGQAWSMMEVALPRDAGPPPHHHPWDEAYYIVEGKVTFSLDGAQQQVGSGEFVYAPGGTVHGFKG